MKTYVSIYYIKGLLQTYHIMIVYKWKTIHLSLKFGSICQGLF